ncbi:hypothetical protein Q5692_37805 [Microcoleus sp. C2C3]|uniref:hypothetical protein n=1 Tax=unclassified Microcoleus TaxID=2642155 RepID=UPI002FD543AD
MTVAELIEILQECDPHSQVGFVESDIVTSIAFVEQKVGNKTELPTDISDSSEVFIYETEPHWPDFDLYTIKTLAVNDARTFAKNVYTRSEPD